MTITRLHFPGLRSVLAALAILLLLPVAASAAYSASYYRQMAAQMRAKADECHRRGVEMTSVGTPSPGHATGDGGQADAFFQQEQVYRNAAAQYDALANSADSSGGGMGGGSSGNVYQQRAAAISQLGSSLMGLYGLWQQHQQEQQAAQEATQAQAEAKQQQQQDFDRMAANVAALFSSLKGPQQQQRDPAQATALVAEGREKLNAKDYDGAKEALDEAIELDDKNAEAFVTRGAAYENKDLPDWKSAEEDYAAALILDPMNQSALASLARAKKLVEAETHYDRAETLAKDDKAQAIQEYTRAIELNGRYTDAYEGRGDLYKELKRYQEAEADYTKAIALDGKDRNAYSGRADVRQALNDFDGAFADAARCTQLDPDNQFAWNTLALLYWKKKDYANADASYTKAIGVMEKRDQAYVASWERYIPYFGRAGERAEAKNFDGAIMDYSQAIAALPDGLSAYLDRAGVYKEMKRFPEALADCTKALGLMDKMDKGQIQFWGRVYVRRAEVRLAMNDFDGAIEDCTQAGADTASAKEAQDLLAAAQKAKLASTGAATTAAAHH